jgi:hypothetical protein
MSKSKKPSPDAAKAALPLSDCSADEWTMGGGWGDAIQWSDVKQFDGTMTTKSRYSVMGWKTPKPKVGHTLRAEFEKSWMIFEFIEIRPCGDPADMFFATVKPIRQELKPNAKLRDAASITPTNTDHAPNS